MKKQFKTLEKSVQFLISKNTKNLKHKKSNFFEHLIGTYNLLLFWNQNFNLCMAGLFHNIYGNKYYDPKLNIKRNEIKKLIGIEAEKIVWNFVNVERNKIVELKNKELLILSLANDLEQNYNLNIKTKKILSCNNQIKNMINNILKNNFKNLEEIYNSIDNIFKIAEKTK
jgi:hypothetical protein